MKTIIQVSDSHINNINNDNFITIIDKVKEYDYQAVVFTGDIAKNGLLSEYLIFQSLIKGINNPFFIIGNHDNAINFYKVFDPKQSQNFYLDKYYIQLINSTVKNQISGFIDINNIENVDNSIIFTHHPILKMQSAWDDNLSITNMAEVQNALSGSTKLVAFGHTHEAKDFKLENILVYSCPASSYGFNGNKIGFNIYYLAQDISKETILIN